MRNISSLSRPSRNNSTNTSNASSESSSLLDDPDVALMLRFQKGDKRAFEELVHKYEANVLNAIYRYTGNRTEAEDLSQEIFLRVFNSRNTYRPISPFKHWLFTILTNLCLNQLRDGKRHKTVSVFQDEESPQLNIRDENNRTVSDEMKKMELKVAVREAVNSLPSRQRMVVVLSKYEEYSYEEIARTMKMSVSAIKSLLYRARESLKDKLKNKLI